MERVVSATQDGVSGPSLAGASPIQRRLTWDGLPSPMNRPLTPTLSPSDGQRVSYWSAVALSESGRTGEGTLAGFMGPMRVQGIVEAFHELPCSVSTL